MPIVQCIVPNIKVVFLSVVVPGSKTHLSVVSFLFHVDEGGKESEGGASASHLGQKSIYRASLFPLAKATHVAPSGYKRDWET